MDIRKFAVEETATIHLRDAADNANMYADDAQKAHARLWFPGPGSRLPALKPRKATA